MPKSRVPAGFHTVTPHLEVRGAAKAIEFYQRAFGAREVVRNLGPDGRRIMHAQLTIGDSTILVHDEFAEGRGESPHTLEGSAVTLHLYVEDADTVFGRAVEAGATVDMPLQNTFWGDRYGQLTDPFGHHWSVAHKLDEIGPDEIRKRAADYFES